MHMPDALIESQAEADKISNAKLILIKLAEIDASLNAECINNMDEVLHLCFDDDNNFSEDLIPFIVKYGATIKSLSEPPRKWNRSPAVKFSAFKAEALDFNFIMPKLRALLSRKPQAEHVRIIAKILKAFNNIDDIWPIKQICGFQEFRQFIETQYQSIEGAEAFLTEYTQ